MAKARPRIEDPEYYRLPLSARALFRDMLDLVKTLGYIPDDSGAVATAIRAPKREVSRWWEEVRALFEPFGEELVHHEAMVEQESYNRAVKQRVDAANSRWLKHRAMRPVCDPYATRIAGPFPHYKEHAGDAGAQAHTVGVLSTQKEKASESADAASHAAVGKMKKPRAPKAPRPLTPKQLRDLSLQEFLWTGDHEAQLQEARKAYPSNRLRIFSDGTTTKCLPGTTEQTRKAWKEILIDHPEVTPRLLKLCLFAYLDQFDLDAKQGIQAGLVNLPTFWAPEKRMWEDWLEVARRNQAEFDAQAQGRLPLEMEA